jgi:hypothetical protein
VQSWNKISILFLAFLVLVPGCKSQALRHDPQLAAMKAELFLKHAILEKDFAAAHRMLREDTQQKLSELTIADAVKKQHSKGYPQSIQATEYEPVPGQAAVQIFLHGNNGSEQFYYRMPMAGTIDDGYFPEGLFRGNRPYPKSNLRSKLNR